MTMSPRHVTGNPRSRSDEAYLQRLIRWKADQLAKRAEFASAEREDLKQDLLAKLTKSLNRFDSRISHHRAFIKAVVERHSATLVRNSRAQKRRSNCVVSLNVLVHGESGEPTELAQLIGNQEVEARTGRYRRPESNSIQLRLDVDFVLKQLPENLQQLAAELAAGKSIARIAREWGRPRTTLQDWVTRIRQQFEEAGFRDYLP